jgi:hypothetical protein
MLGDLRRRSPAEGYWQAAIEALILVAEKNGPTMFARIDVMRALYPKKERVFEASGKTTHWGKQKLKQPLAK